MKVFSAKKKIYLMKFFFSLYVVLVRVINKRENIIYDILPIEIWNEKFINFVI